MHLGKPVVPDAPIIPFIEGDGTGPDIWRATRMVLEAAVAKAYGGKRAIEWLEVLAGEKAFNQTGEWLPEATLEEFRTYLVGIKGPLTTPVGGGIRTPEEAGKKAAAGADFVVVGNFFEDDNNHGLMKSFADPHR